MTASQFARQSKDGCAQIRMSEDELETIDALARATGLDRSKLLRKWIMQRLEIEQLRQAAIDELEVKKRRAHMLTIYPQRGGEPRYAELENEIARLKETPLTWHYAKSRFNT